MKILILSWRGIGHPCAGGAEVSTHYHAKGWVKAGHHVTLFTSTYSGCKTQELIDGVKIIRCGSQVLKVHFNAFKWYISQKHEEFDLIVDQFHGIPFFTPLYIKEKKLAFIHEVTKEVWSLNPWRWPFNLIPACIGTLFEPLVFKLFYRNVPFMTVSKSTKEDLIQWGIPKENITIVHNGLEVPIIKPLLQKEKKKTLIYLGALSKDKGINETLMTFAILNKQSGSFQFWIVGKGDPFFLKYLKQKIRKLGIDNKVKYWGFVGEEKKYELLSKAHILICPSVREGWGLVVIEAASVGTPSVAFNVPGLRDSIQDRKTGVLSDNTPERMAEEIIKLLENEIEYSKIRRNAIVWSKNFSWDKSVKESLDLIEKVTEK